MTIKTIENWIADLELFVFSLNLGFFLKNKAFN